ncbi:MAG: hypothetical protein QM785_02140 [Pyrinomonadaceae bacterium]
MFSEWVEIKRDDVLPQYSGLHITMNQKGYIVMSRVTHEQLGSPAWFRLLYDEANHRIGLKPVEPSTPHAYPALKSNRTGIMVRAYRLMREKRLSLPHTMQFDDAAIDTDGILVLDLRTARPSRRAKARNERDIGSNHE